MPRRRVLGAGPGPGPPSWRSASSLQPQPPTQPGPTQSSGGCGWAARKSKRRSRRRRRRRTAGRRARAGARVVTGQGAPGGGAALPLHLLRRPTRRPTGSGGQPAPSIGRLGTSCSPGMTRTWRPSLLTHPPAAGPQRQVGVSHSHAHPPPHLPDSPLRLGDLQLRAPAPVGEGHPAVGCEPRA